MRTRILLLLAVVAAPAMAQSQDKPTSAENDEKKICRREQVTGSILPGKRICHTRAEWREHDERTQQSARDALDRMPHRSGDAPGS